MGDLKNYIIRNHEDKYELVENSVLIPSILIEKKNAFQLIGAIPYSTKLKCDLIYCGCRTNSFVWISHSKKAIYFENPKAGSSSIKKLLGIKAASLVAILIQLKKEWQYVGDYEVIIRDYMYNLTTTFIQDAINKVNEIIALGINFVNYNDLTHHNDTKSDFQVYYGSADEALENFKSYFSFAFYRDPVERFLSNHRMFFQKEIRFIHLKTLVRNEPDAGDLSEFIQIATNFNNHHWNPQCRFFPKEDSFNSLTYLLNITDYDKGMKEICNRLDIVFESTAINTTIKSNNETMMPSTEQIEAIRSMYFEDYKRFNFR